MQLRLVPMLSTLGLLALAAGCSSPECTTASDCGPGERCEAEKCVTAATEGCSPACADPTPVCDAKANTCVVCTPTEGCPAGQVCDVDSEGGACVTCVEDSHCSGAAPVCDEAVHACVTCIAQRGCPSDQECDTTVPGGLCIGCLDDGECPAQSPICDEASASCVVCNDDRGCRGKQVCDRSQGVGRCVDCSIDADCPEAAPLCDPASRTCVVCTKDEGCAGETPHCAAGRACVECVESAHCTADPAKPFCTAGGSCVSTDPGPTSAQIAAVRAAADGTDLSLPVWEAVVTYVRPAVGEDPAGFFVQAERAGPALFVAEDPATFVPEVVPGARVSFTVDALTTVERMRRVSQISNYSQSGVGEAVSGFVQELSTASDLVSALDSYESELVSLTGRLGPFTDGGVAHLAATLATSGLSVSGLKLRIPESLRAELDLTEGCSVTLTAGPMWRHRATAQPMAFSASDLGAITCPGPKVLLAESASLEQVVVAFDRVLDSSSVLPDGSQFTFDNGLTATAATVDGKEVALTTSSQTPDATYTVTVANTVRDSKGTPVSSTANSAQFTAQYPQARLLINEVNPNIPTSRDLIEFLVVSAGTTKQLKVVAQASSSTTLATFPDVAMEAGDLIVLHLNPGADSPSASERQSKSESTAALAFPDAWDFIGGSAGLSFSHRVLMVKTATGEVQDAVVFVNSDLAGTAPAGFPAAVAAMQNAGHWSPADCGGAECSYTSSPTVLDIAVEWKDVGNQRGSSLSRISGQDTNSKTDWVLNLTGSSFGAANP